MDFVQERKDDIYLTRVQVMIPHIKYLLADQTSVRVESTSRLIGFSPPRVNSIR